MPAPAEMSPKPIELTPTVLAATMAELSFVPDDNTQPRQVELRGDIRSYLQAGSYHEQPAEFKCISDKREIDSAAAQAHFLAIPADVRGSVAAPAMYGSKKIGQHTTAIVMERLPEHRQLQSPLSAQDRQTFLAKPFADLMRIKDQLAYREPHAAENLPIDQFCAERFKQWCHNAEQRIKDDNLPPELLTDTAQLQQAVVELIQRSYGNTALEWTYGLPKPDKFHQVGEKYYLTDFKLIGKRPPGYDLAIAAWADAIMPTLWDTQLDEATAVQQLQECWQSWMDDWQTSATQQGLPTYQPYVKAMLAERLLGSLYGDVIADRVRPQEQSVQDFAEETTRQVQILKTVLHALTQA